MTLRERLAAADAALFRAERAVVGALFVLMGGVVFADVVHRIFSRAPGRLSMIAGGWLGVSPDTLEAFASPVIIGLTTVFFFYAAVRTRTPDPGKPIVGRRRALLLGLGIAVVAVAVVQAYVRLKPDGIVWAPYLALVTLLWIGLIGASMATYNGRHLALEMGEKLWPARAQPAVRLVAQVATAGFAVLLVLLGAMSAADHYQAWSASTMSALIPAVDLPKWVVFVVVPYAFGVIALRYGLRAAGLLTPPAAPEIPT